MGKSLPGGLSTSLACLALAACGPPSGYGPRDGAAGPLPVYGELAGFELVDQAGEPFRNEDLAGHVWVADFIFTRCPTICPQLTRHLQEVAHQWRKEPRVRLLSLSVDPAYDTPGRLAEYRSEWRMADRWTLLTGDPPAMRQLVRESFHLAFDGDFARDGDITHSSRFVLIDGAGRIRGYFNTTEEGFESGLEQAVERLLGEIATGGEGRAEEG